MHKWISAILIRKHRAADQIINPSTGLISVQRDLRISIYLILLEDHVEILDHINRIISVRWRKIEELMTKITD